MSGKFLMNDDEKLVLRYLYENRQVDIATFDKLSKSRINTATKKLEAMGFIFAHYEEGGNVVAARIVDAGIAYIEINPALEDPLSFEIERLTKENLMLQNNELEHKAKVRKLEDVIRLRKFVDAVVGTVIVIAGAVGWLLYFIKIR